MVDTVKRGIEKHADLLARDRENDEFLQKMATLTQRERQVIELVLESLLNKLIADQLDIAEATVKVHRGRAMEKMGVTSVAELARQFERAKLS